MRRVCLLRKRSEREAARGGDEHAHGEHEDVHASVRACSAGARRRGASRRRRGERNRARRSEAHDATGGPRRARARRTSPRSAHGRRPFAGSPWSEGGGVPLRDQPAGTGLLPPVSRGSRQDREGAWLSETRFHGGGLAAAASCFQRSSCLCEIGISGSVPHRRGPRTQAFGRCSAALMRDIASAAVACSGRGRPHVADECERTIPGVPSTCGSATASNSARSTE
jgi:hypothetical protein